MIRIQKYIRAIRNIVGGGIDTQNMLLLKKKNRICPISCKSLFTLYLFAIRRHPHMTDDGIRAA